MSLLDLPEIVPAPHPEFGLAALRSIRLPDNWQQPETATYLANSISRKPGNLMAHARRIALHEALADGAGVTAAVIDLFIALADKGQSLKRHILARHAAVLKSAGCHDLLAAAVTGQLSPHDSRIALPGSVLAKPMDGHFEFLRPAPEPSAEDEAALRRELIEEFKRQGLFEEAAELEAEYS